MMAATCPNPYPGPRSFQKGERLFGRGRETAELLDLLIAERIVLLYSPSGAGKTSLVQAALIPELECEGFRVLPTLRLGYLTADSDMPRVNRYLTSLLLSLERDLPETEQTPLTELTDLLLNEYLDRQPVPAGDAWHGDVLIFDQFEEILTVDSGGRATKAEFFEQVGKALRDRNRWALFSMREEFVAGLDPYLHHIPTRFDKGHRYRLELLGPAAAQEAMQAPARAASVAFTDAAASRLTDDLRAVRIQQPDGVTVVAQGDYVEPVQLQVVCRRLWDKLAADDRSIDLDDVQDVGDVDTALRDYYTDSVAAVAAKTGIRERVIREWLDKQLITAQGIRGQVLLGPDASPPDSNGLANRAIWPLVDAHLVRAEQRRGATWFELAHDRLIAPVRKDNADWRDKNLVPLQRQAALWDSQDRTKGLLLNGEALQTAEQWAAAHANELESHERDFLEACREAQAIAEHERRQSLRIQRLAVVLAMIGLVALASSGIAWQNSVQAKVQAQLATSRELAAAANASLSRDPERSILLADRALTLSRTSEAEEALRRALQETRVTRRFFIKDEGFRRVAYSPDGAYLAAGGRYGRIYIWKLANETANPENSWDGQGGTIMAIVYNSDGSQLTTAQSDNTARLWDASTGQLLQTLSGHESPVMSVAFGPDDRLVATGSLDHTARIWDAATGVEKLSLYGHTGGVTRVAFSPDGAKLATASEDGTVRLWDVTSGDELLKLMVDPEQAVYAVAFSPDGMQLATAGANLSTDIWDISGPTAKKLHTMTDLTDHTNTVVDVSFSPNGDCLATASLDRTAKVWNAHTGRLLVNLAGHTDWIYSVTFAPEARPAGEAPRAEQCGSQLATASQDATVRTWNIGANGEYRTYAGHMKSIESIVFSANGNEIATASDDGAARLWDTGTGKVLLDVQAHDQRANTAILTPDGRYLATAGWDGTAKLWDTQTGQLSMTIADPDDSRVNSVAFNQKGTLLATGSDEGAIRLWSVPSGALVSKLTQSGAVLTLAFNRDDTLLASGASDGKIVLWNPESGEAVAELDHGGQVYQVEFSPDGSRLGSGGGNWIAKLWAVPSGQLLHTLSGHDGRVYGLRFSPDGRRVATTGADETIKTWDVGSGQLVSTIPGVEFNSVDYSPDGQLLAAGGQDGAVRLYVTDVKALQNLAATRLTRWWTPDECRQFLHQAECPPRP
jgi:WD40 repeat protein